MIPAKYTARFINGAAFKPSDWGENGKPIVRIAQLTGGELDNFYDGEINPRNEIDDGELLFSWSATLDSFEWNRGPAVLNQHIFKVIPFAGTHKRFLYYSLKHYAAIWADMDAHGSTMRHIKKESLGNKIWLPDYEDQKTISDFLDAEVSKLDGLYEKKSRLSQLVREKISLVSDDLVMNGLNNSSRLKSTDIPWLPAIPEPWNLLRAKYIYKEAKRSPAVNDGIITAFRDGQVCLREKRRSEGYTFATLEVGYQRILQGDLVIHTMDAFAGAIGVSEDDGKSTGEYAVCDALDGRSNNHYYAYVLRRMARHNYIYILCPSVRERAPRFRFVRFSSILLPVPPYHEQDAIVREIDKQTSELRKLRSLEEQSMQRLREFRAAIITAAVTGKVDVASWRKQGQMDRRLDQIEAVRG